MANNRSRLYCREWLKWHEREERLNPTTIVLIDVPGKAYQEIHVIPIKELDEWKAKYGGLMTTPFEDW